mmetsp:Transcript_19425/g.73390  ORF Transcript_19425/g.73390 Transcript_19425/m.73390 type:complete len:310 (+) Transcript_19425:1869-2798(+)
MLSSDATTSIPRNPRTISNPIGDVQRRSVARHRLTMSFCSAFTQESSEKTVRKFWHPITSCWHMIRVSPASSPKLDVSGGGSVRGMVFRRLLGRPSPNSLSTISRAVTSAERSAQDRLVAHVDTSAALASGDRCGRPSRLGVCPVVRISKTGALDEASSLSTSTTVTIMCRNDVEIGTDWRASGPAALSVAATFPTGAGACSSVVPSAAGGFSAPWTAASITGTTRWKPLSPSSKTHSWRNLSVSSWHCRIPDIQSAFSAGVSTASTIGRAFGGRRTKAFTDRLVPRCVSRSMDSSSAALRGRKLSTCS